MEIRKLCVEYGRTPKVLMLGNGINRAFGFASWDDLIESIRTKDLTSEEKEALKNVPYPLQPVILTEDHLGTQMRSISKELSDLRAPEAEEEMLRTAAFITFLRAVTMARSRNWRRAHLMQVLMRSGSM